jgi:hypothetical protein
LLSGTSVPACAQIAPGLQCTFNAAVIPTVRAEGLSEPVGDIVLNCTGGTPTPVGVPIPTANITVFLGANITSRITSNPFTEVLMLLDEPHWVGNPGTPLAPCDPSGATLGICPLTGNGTGVETYTTANVFQARYTGVNQVTFFGVPIDPPGMTGTRIIRITNLRGNANQLGVSNTLVPTQIVANISVSPPNLLPLNNPQQTVAFSVRGLTVTASDNAQPFTPCNGQAFSGAKKNETVDPQFEIRFVEGFPAAWKEKNIQEHLSNAPGASPQYHADAAQDVPGANYFSESGFLANGFSPASLIMLPGYGPFLSANPAFPTVRGMSEAGRANAGSRLLMSFRSVPKKTDILVPACVNLKNASCSSCPPTGFAVLTATDANGNGAFAPAGGGAPWVPVTLNGDAGIAVYEILYSDPFNFERATIPYAVVNPANGKDVPASKLRDFPLATGTYAPLSSAGDASATAPVPRFVALQ